MRAAFSHLANQPAACCVVCSTSSPSSKSIHLVSFAWYAPFGNAP